MSVFFSAKWEYLSPVATLGKMEALPVISILCSCRKLGICCLQNFGAELRYILSVIGTFIISRV